MAECSELAERLRERYGSDSTAALVVAYAEGFVEFITPEAFVDHVEGNTPKALAHELKVLRRTGANAVDALNERVLERERVVRSVGAEFFDRFALDADF